MCVKMIFVIFYFIDYFLKKFIMRFILAYYLEMINVFYNFSDIRKKRTQYQDQDGKKRPMNCVIIPD